MSTYEENEALCLSGFQAEGWDLPGHYGHLRPGLSREGLSKALLREVLSCEGTPEPTGLTDTSSLVDRAKYALRTAQRSLTLTELNVMMAIQKDGLPHDWARVKTFIAAEADLKPHIPERCLEFHEEQGRKVITFCNTEALHCAMWDRRCYQQATNQYMALMCLEYIRLAIDEDAHHEALQQLRRAEPGSTSTSLLERAKNKANRYLSKPRAEPDTERLASVDSIRQSAKRIAERFPFFDYAVHCWASHWQSSEGRIQPAVMERLMAHANVVLGSRNMAFIIMCHRMGREPRVLEEHNFTLTEPHGTPETMLKLACLFGAQDIVQQVLTQGRIRVLPEHLIFAIYSARASLVQLVKEELPDGALQGAAEFIATPPWLLAKALNEGYIMSELARWGFPEVSADARGRTASRYATELWDSRLFESCMRYGHFDLKDLGAPDNDGVTPAAHALRHGRPDIAAVIQKAIRGQK